MVCLKSEVPERQTLRDCTNFWLGEFSSNLDDSSIRNEAKEYYLYLRLACMISLLTCAVCVDFAQEWLSMTTCVFTEAANVVNGL